jgi:hypothetical protein
MSIDKNISVHRMEAAETCFKCEESIKPGEKVIRFTFSVDLVITKKEISEHAHLSCAEEFHALLGRRIAEAFKGK